MYVFITSGSKGEKHHVVTSFLTLSMVWGPKPSDHLGADKKCRISSSVPHLLTQNLHLARCPGDSDRCWSLRGTALTVSIPNLGGRKPWSSCFGEPVLRASVYVHSNNTRLHLRFAPEKNHGHCHHGCMDVREELDAWTWCPLCTALVWNAAVCSLQGIHARIIFKRKQILICIVFSSHT